MSWLNQMPVGIYAEEMRCVVFNGQPEVGVCISTHRKRKRGRKSRKKGGY